MFVVAVGKQTGGNALSYITKHILKHTVVRPKCRRMGKHNSGNKLVTCARIRALTVDSHAPN